MKPLHYFLVNDTRYDNHHGCLTVVKNLHLAMSRRGWACSGSLPVSSDLRQLDRQRQQISNARLVIVNGEGSLHHDSRNTERIFAICQKLGKTHPIVLLNSVWQDNDADRWAPMLAHFVGVYARDRRSQKQLQAIGIDAGYSPDLTFYDYPEFPSISRSGFLCTDSVLSDWTKQALHICHNNSAIDFLTMFTGEMSFSRGTRDWDKRIKYRVYPWLWQTLGIPVPARYRSLPFAIKDTTAFLKKLSCANAVCVARYHALCFVLQQRVPFVAVASNSHKSESLLEEVGLPIDQFTMGRDDLVEIRTKLEQAGRIYPHYAAQITDFNRNAKHLIDTMFDQILGAL